MSGFGQFFCVNVGALHRLLLCCLFGGTVLSLQAHASELKIELRDKVMLDKPAVSLNDLANISTNDLPLLRRMMEIPIGRAPRLGQSTTLDRDVVERWVNRYLHVTNKSVQWSGATQITVTTVAQEVRGEKIAEVAKTELCQWLMQFGEKNAVELAQVPRDVAVPKGEVTLLARPLVKQHEPNQRMSMYVDIHVGGRFIRTIPVSFEVSIFKQVWVTKRDLSAGELMSETDVEQKEFQVVGKLGQIVEANLADQRVRTRSKLSKGELLTKQHVEPMPVALRGEFVNLIVKSGALELESVVEVLREGRLGDVIPVKGKNTSGTVMAKIIGEGKVEMKL